MAPPANIRFNTLVPFPALVKGSGPITIAKQAGYWIVGFAASVLGVQNPPANFGADLALVWDPIAKTLILTPLSGLILPTARLQRSITGAGNLPIIGTDSILNINAATDLAPALPAYAGRNGATLTFKLVPGSHSQTITGGAGNQIDGQNTVPLAAGSLTLVPYNDGVNTGWAVE